jgi:hypothetical protein
MNLITFAVVILTASLLCKLAVQTINSSLRKKPIIALVSEALLHSEFTLAQPRSIQFLFSLILVFTCFLVTPTSQADSIDRKKLLKIEAAYLYKFTKFIQWPDYRFEHSSNLNICLVGKNLTTLNQLLTRGIAGKQSNGRTVQVYYYQTPQIESGHHGCHLIYLDQFLADQLIPQTDTSSTLLISSPNTPNNRDSLIHLKVSEGKLVFFINQNLLTSSLLEINAALLSLARKTYD